jgi:hypothetical protein
MNTLDRELDTLTAELVPPLINLEQLERLVTEDDRLLFDGDCAIHDSCRAIG